MKKRTFNDIAVNLDWQKDRKRYRSVYERQAEIRRGDSKEIYGNLNKQEIERDSGGKKGDKNRYRWIDEDQADIKKMGLIEIGINLDLQKGIKKQRWIGKRYKQIQVNI